MVDDYMLDKAFDKVKELIGIKKFDYTKILIKADDKVLDDCDINFAHFKRW